MQEKQCTTTSKKGSLYCEQEEGIEKGIRELERNKTLTSLTLSATKNLTPKQAKRLIEVIKKNTSLTELYFYSEMLMQKDSNLFLEVLRNSPYKFTSLRFNHLRCVDFSPLCELLKSKQPITTLNIEYAWQFARELGDIELTKVNNGLSYLIKYGICNNTTLTSLDLYRNALNTMHANDFAQCLTTNTTLTALNMSDNDIGTEGATQLGTALKSNYALRTLTVANNYITDLSGFAEGLGDNHTLVHLDLAKNPSDRAGLEKLVEALKGNHALLSLGLDYCKLGDTVAIKLAYVLAFYNRTLKSLRLANNSIGEAGFKAFAELIKRNDTLTSLDFFDSEEKTLRNQPGQAGLTVFAEAMRFNRTIKVLKFPGCDVQDSNVVQFIDVLAANSSLSELDLNGNLNITDNSAEKLASFLCENVSLKKLAIQYTNISDKGIIIIINALQTNTTLISIAFGSNTFMIDTKRKIIEKLYSSNYTLTSIRLAGQASKSNHKFLRSLQSIDQRNKDIAPSDDKNTLQKTSFNEDFFNVVTTFGQAYRQQQDNQQPSKALGDLPPEIFLHVCSFLGPINQSSYASLRLILYIAKNLKLLREIRQETPDIKLYKFKLPNSTQQSPYHVFFYKEADDKKLPQAMKYYFSYLAVQAEEQECIKGHLERMATKEHNPYAYMALYEIDKIEKHKQSAISLKLCAPRLFYEAIKAAEYKLAEPLSFENFQQIALT